MRYSDVLRNEYFEWMYNLVINDRDVRDLSYRKLLSSLHSVKFTYILDRDGNRAGDGISLRYRFGRAHGYSREVIEEYIDVRPCSVLEMMIALALRIEEDIMDDYDYGDRTGQWFWSMIISLGLATEYDSRFDREYVESTISAFLNRKYKRNGKGGLFTLTETRKDLRKVEIWYQAMWFLDENFDFSV